MKSAGKVWGTTQQIEKNSSFEFHRIEFKANHECSQHKHQTKSNGFFVESGCLAVKVWQGESSTPDITILHAGDYMSVPAGKWHQFVGIRDGIAFEVYWAEFDADDIIRRTTGKRIDDAEPVDVKGPEQDLNWDGQSEVDVPEWKRKERKMIEESKYNHGKDSFFVHDGVKYRVHNLGPCSPPRLEIVNE